MIKEILQDARERMDKTIEALHTDLRAIRTGRASPALVERVQVEYYGVPTPMNQLAGITVPEPRLLVIRPWDRSTIGIIEKAILKSDLGLNPSNDGQVIRLIIPQLTEERRRELSKQVAKRVEEARVSARNIRRDAIDMLRDLEKEKDDQRGRAIRGARQGPGIDRRLHQADRRDRQGQRGRNPGRLSHHGARPAHPGRDPRTLPADHPHPLPCRHHHGRQWAVGARTRAAPAGRPQGRDREHPPRAARGGGFRHQGADGLRVLHRELGPTAGRGRRADAHPGPGHQTRNRRP